VFKSSIIPIIAAGFFSSAAFASADLPTPKPTPTKIPGRELAYNYSCWFKEKHGRDLKTLEDKHLKCWVRGFFCTEKDKKMNADENADKIKEACDGIDNPISIACNDGFKLTAENSAVAIEDRTLWINAEKEKERDAAENLLGEHSKDKIATLRVEDFLPRKDEDLGPTFFRDADLLISEKRGDADRLSGQCEFNKVDLKEKKPLE